MSVNCVVNGVGGFGLELMYVVVVLYVWVVRSWLIWWWIFVKNLVLLVFFGISFLICVLRGFCIFWGILFKSCVKKVGLFVCKIFLSNFFVFVVGSSCRVWLRLNVMFCLYVKFVGDFLWCVVNVVIWFFFLWVNVFE